MCNMSNEKLPFGKYLCFSMGVQGKQMLPLTRLWYPDVLPVFARYCLFFTAYFK